MPWDTNRAGIRHAVLQPQSQEAREREAVVDQKFGGFVRQIVPRLDNQGLEHRHRVEGRTTALSFV